MWCRPLRKQLRSAKCFLLLICVLCFIWSWQDSNLQFLVPKTNALSTRPQDQLITSQATITKPLPELLPPRRSGENVSNLQVLRVAAGIIFEMFPAPRKAFTKFFHNLCCSVFQEFSQVVYKAFTRLLQGLYKVVTRPSPCFFIFYKVLTKQFTRIVRGFQLFLVVLYKAVTLCLAMLLQGFYKCFYNDFYMIFTRCLTKLFTRCFTRCLQSVLQKLLIMFLQCVWRGFLHGVCEVLCNLVYKVSTRLWQGLCRVSTRLLQQVHKVLAMLSRGA